MGVWLMSAKGNYVLVSRWFYEMCMYSCDCKTCKSNKGD